MSLICGASSPEGFAYDLPLVDPLFEAKSNSKDALVSGWMNPFSSKKHMSQKVPSARRLYQPLLLSSFAKKADVLSYPHNMV